MNKEASELLKRIIKEQYQNIRLDSLSSNDDEFYYEFKIDDVISENDFLDLENKIHELNKNIYVKLIRISGVYYNGDAKGEMVTRISGKAFKSLEELIAYNRFLEEAKKRDHRRIGKDLDLFCFSDYVGPGLPLYTPRGTIVKDALQ